MVREVSVLNEERYLLVFVFVVCCLCLSHSLSHCSLFTVHCSLSLIDCVRSSVRSSVRPSVRSFVRSFVRLVASFVWLLRSFGCFGRFGSFGSFVRSVASFVW